MRNSQIEDSNMQCIFPQGQTTPERVLSNPWYDKGFFEPNQYKAAIDRCQGGYEACDLFIEIFSTRAEIEREYAASIEKWSSNSIKQISNSKEFGSNKKAWLESIRASKKTAAVHEEIAQHLKDSVIDKMVAYKKENYGKSFVHVKKIKEFEHDFEQAQKSWIKLLDRINKAKKEFQDADKQLKKAEKAEKIIESDRGIDDTEKNQVKMSVDSYRKQSEALKQKYDQLIVDMENARPNYESAMKEVLDRTHAFERKRLAQFKALLSGLQQALVINNDPHLTKMSELFTTAINGHDAEKDIQWWNSHYGSEINSAWPKAIAASE